MKRYVFQAMIFISSLSTVFGCNATEKIVYVNYAPDIRYSLNGIDSKIVFNPEANGFGYGNYFGNIEPCDTKAKVRCFVFDSMAVSEVPSIAGVGSRFSVGPYTFIVREIASISILGHELHPLRVDMMAGDQTVNSYLYCRDKGVVAILPLNFENKEIPQSIFFLQSAVGLFAAQDEK